VDGVIVRHLQHTGIQDGLEIMQVVGSPRDLVIDHPYVTSQLTGSLLGCHLHDMGSCKMKHAIARIELLFGGLDLAQDSVGLLCTFYRLKTSRKVP
jgi:hypothetical protein